MFLLGLPLNGGVFGRRRKDPHSGTEKFNTRSPGPPEAFRPKVWAPEIPLADTPSSALKTRVPVVGPRAIDGRVFSLIFQPAGGGGYGVGGGDLGLVHSVHVCLQFWFKCTFPRMLVLP